MIYYMTGLYKEAAPLIKGYGMKKLMDIKAFQAFRGKNQLLIISGTEAADASVSSCHLLTLFPPKSEDIFVCVRFYPHITGRGEICHKLRDIYSSKDFYPDLLARHPFEEGTWDDAYFALAYQTAVRFLPSHGIHLVKVASADFCGDVANWADGLAEIKFSESLEISEDVKEKFELLCDNLKLGYTTRLEFLKLLRGYAARNGNYDILEAQMNHIAATKREGKELYAKIEKQLRK